MKQESVSAPPAEASSNASVSVIDHIQVKQEQRQNFDLYQAVNLSKDNDNEQDKQMHKPNEKTTITSEEFKRFMLQCYWQRRVSRSEVLQLNLHNVIKVFKMAQESNNLNLMQSMLILLGIQKIHERKLLYLLHDSKYFLSQMEDPFSIKTENEVHVKGESE